MTINGLSGYSNLSTANTGLTVASKRSMSESAPGFALDAGDSSATEGSDSIDFSSLPSDLVKILRQGNGELPSPKDIAEMAKQEQYINLPTGYGNGVASWHELTAGDKQLIKDATGFDMFSDPLGKTLSSPDVQSFIGRLNLDRYSDSHYGNSSGLNGGEITGSYINKLIQENISAAPGQATVPLSILYRVQASLATQTEGASKSVKEQAQ